MKKHNPAPGILFTFLLFFYGLTAFAGVYPAPETSPYNVKLYGVKGDGKTIDTKGINKAIDAAATAGGGTVYFPAGNYLCGSIHLQSNISLYIDQGATIIAAPITDESGYDLPEDKIDNKYQDFGHRHWHNSLIWGENLHDISILGPGTLWGKDLVRSNKGEDDKRPNKTISLYLCRNVIIKDISILHGGWFGILATGIDNFTIDNVKMDTNRDGMDIDCCRNVRISNCSVNSPYDDGICLKSTFGLGFARATENVTITNCQVSGYDEGSFLDGTFKRNEKKYSDGNPTGRIKMGTESNGGFKNVTISNCVFDYCRGLALETVDGALLEDVTITNITMRDIVNAPIFVRLGARMRGPEGTPVGALRRVIISNVVCYNADNKHGAIISGIPGHDIEDLRLSNIRIYYKGGGTKEQSTREVPDLEKEYPEPYRFGTMPSYGFFIRNVKGLKMNDVEVSYIDEDLRPAFILDHVTGADFQHIKAQKAANAPAFVLNEVKDFNIYNSLPIANTRMADVNKKEL
ncbi:glycoside hydrolase family 28 protein [Mucilaginibacter sp. KACC 22773]|uniref:rhamnogalacturonidase n=1 Tax=Mucilaginibacter sp. KACC 22773 TaxID=3025671 RepID=UPI0023653A43|nr:glycoside hydrolase family 28 protein [Mucilaginibacter sp. KACC 22773]WDF75697.1 glycoside hydrolase family 28 protein [Mucilaginibacter sp. KACC 22773]